MSVVELRKKYLTAISPLDADLLLATAANKSREFILIHPEYRLSFRQKVRFLYFLFQYKRRMPIAYITGHKEFFGLDFFVNQHTLIPRPETELLIEEVLKKITNQTILIDVGTGSGCIPIAILKTIKESNAKMIKVFATDISKQALRIAEKNAIKHGVDINFVHGNLFEPFLKNFQLLTLNQKLIVTANLPYLTQEQFKKEPSIQNEPKSALIAAENGLALYRELLEQLKRLNCPFTSFFEFDPRQSDWLTKLISSTLPNAKIEIKKDLAGRDRLAIIYFN